QRGLEAAIDRHHLAGGLHLGAKAAVGRRELVERPARDLYHDVIERGLEGRGRLLGHRIRDLIETLPDGDLRRDPRDRIAGRLRGERGAARYPRVHLDNEVRHLRVGLIGGRVIRMQRELNVAAALDAEGTNDPESRRAKHLVFLVDQRLRGADYDRAVGVYQHRVKVPNGAADDACVRAVAHHLVLDLLPAGARALAPTLSDG